MVPVIQEHGRCVPIEFFLRHERSALQDEDLLAGLGEFEGHGSPARTTADDDRVVFSRHEK